MNIKNKKRITIEDKLKQKREETNIRNKLNIEDENTKVVIEKKNPIIQLLIFLRNTFGKLLKLSFLLSVAVFSTIGLTVMINEVTRTEFIELIKQTFSH